MTSTTAQAEKIIFSIEVPDLGTAQLVDDSNAFLAEDLKAETIKTWIFWFDEGYWPNLYAVQSDRITDALEGWIDYLCDIESNWLITPEELESGDYTGTEGEISNVTFGAGCYPKFQIPAMIPSDMWHVREYDLPMRLLTSAPEPEEDPVELEIEELRLRNPRNPYQSQ
jgi:hypothetical protein